MEHRLDCPPATPAAPPIPAPPPLPAPTPSQVLSELGLSDKTGSVDLRQLSLLLNDEMMQSQDIINFPSVTAAVATFQSEV